MIIQSIFKFIPSSLMKWQCSIQIFDFCPEIGEQNIIVWSLLIQWKVLLLHYGGNVMLKCCGKNCTFYSWLNTTSMIEWSNFRFSLDLVFGHIAYQHTISYKNALNMDQTCCSTLLFDTFYYIIQKWQISTRKFLSLRLGFYLLVAEYSDLGNTRALQLARA